MHIKVCIFAALSHFHKNAVLKHLAALTSVHSIVVSDVESTSVRVSWQAVENADRYTVTLSQTMGNAQLGLMS